MIKTIIKYISTVITFSIALAILEYLKADTFIYFAVGVISSVVSRNIEDIIDDVSVKNK